MKKIYTFFAASFCTAMFFSHTQRSSVPGTGLTGATGAFCTNCHSSFSINSGGGGVTVSGLPTSSYNAGQVYNFTLGITHGAADRRRWGFSIAAVNPQGQAVGTFSTTNGNAGVNGSELSHNNAATTALASSFTYNNLTWTAPANPGVNDANVTFFYVANAANQDGGTGGDHIYSGSSAVTLPIQLSKFTAKADANFSTALQWTSASEVNAAKFQIQKSDDNQYYYSIHELAVRGSGTNYSFVDTKVSYFNKPVFYRLKMIDKDGSSKYSEVVTVKHEKAKNLIENLYPSLVTRGAKITLHVICEQNQAVEISYLNASGNLLQTTRNQLHTGSNVFQVAVPNSTTPGIHFVKLVGPGWSQTVPVVVQ